jgi:predicted aminopeptidase
VKKKIVWVIVLLLAAVLIYYRDLIGYGWMQGKGQLSILWEARPIEEFLDDSSFPDSLKVKLRLVQEIRTFAVDSLGISPSDNYTTMYNQQGENLLWTVTAAEPFALVPYRWKFPLLGSFPYKGYFDLDKAKLERARLDSAGYDTHIGMVSGWSTLGWFKDPILSKMLEREDGDLAELIIHELTHGTLYVKDSVEFNENLASFVGRMGALRFLKHKFGPNSAELATYVNSEVDYEKIYRHYLTGARKLDSLYKAMNESMSVAKKSELKEGMIYRVMQSLDTLSFRQRKPFQWKPENRLPNNTFFMSYLRYRGKLDSFEKELQEKFGGDLRAYVTYLKELYPSL